MEQRSSYNCKMLRDPALAILALILSIPFLGGCSPANENAGANGNVSTPGQPITRTSGPGIDGVKDGSEELGALIKLPFEPDDLVWKEFQAGKPGQVQGRRLLAVFQLTPQEAKALIDRSAKAGAGSPAVLSVEKWFPPELIAQSEMSSDAGITVTTYPADDFFQEPFTRGTISNVDDTDFFVLELFTV